MSRPQLTSAIRRRLAFALLALSGGTVSVGAHGNTPATLSLLLAERIGTAVLSCGARKQKGRSVHILDEQGLTVYAARMDGQFADNMDVAHSKARSALFFRADTRHALARSRNSTANALQIAQLGQFTSPTGIPIVIDGQLVGALGIGGASGDCAYEALERVLGTRPP